jgi:siroheme synthase-like protein
MPSSAAGRFAYPVFLDLHDVLVLVVGGGRIGARKADGLIAAGARVRLVAALVSGAVDRAGCAEVIERPFQDTDLDDVRLVITATGDAGTDRVISTAARSRRIWTNAADQPADCEFILPAIARSGRVTVAVSTDGASPALARELRDRMATDLGPDVANFAEELAAQRAAIRAGGASTEDIEWGERIRLFLDGR